MASNGLAKQVPNFQHADPLLGLRSFEFRGRFCRPTGGHNERAMDDPPSGVFLGLIAVASAETLPKLLSPRLSDLQRDVATGRATQVDYSGSKSRTTRRSSRPTKLPRKKLGHFPVADSGATRDVVVVARLNGIVPFQDAQSHMIQLKGTRCMVPDLPPPHRVPLHLLLLCEFSGRCRCTGR